jgi:hypothetical protein
LSLLSGMRARAGESSSSGGGGEASGNRMKEEQQRMLHSSLYTYNTYIRKSGSMIISLKNIKSPFLRCE